MSADMTADASAPAGCGAVGEVSYVPQGGGATGAASATMARIVLARRAVDALIDAGRPTAYGLVGPEKVELARALARPCDRVYVARAGHSLAVRLPKVPFALIIRLDAWRVDEIIDLLKGVQLVVHDAGRVFASGRTVTLASYLQFCDTRLLAGLNHYATSDAEPGLDLFSAARSYATAWNPPPPSDEDRFAAFEAALTERLHEALPTSSSFTHAIKRQVRRVVELEHFALPAFVQLNANGIRIDRCGWERELASRRERHRHLEARLRADLGVADLASHAQVRLGLRRFGVEVRKAGGAELAERIDVPVVADLLEYRRLHAFLQDLGPRVLERIEPDGRLRAYYDSMGAATGRVASSGPNVMAIPRDMRRFVVADDGCVFVDADYSTIEVRLVAALTKEPTLIAAFQRGVDVHRLTASKVLGKPYADVSDDERRMAKPVNFGWLYGMSADGFVDSALETYGLKFSREEAHALRRRFFAAYPRIREWHDSVRAATSPRIVTASGRLRIVPPVPEKDPGRPFRVRANTVIQGSAADGMKLSLGLLAGALPYFGARLVATVHDQVLVEVREERAEEVRELVVALMKQGMGHYVSAVPIDVEAKIKRTWGG